MRAPAQHPSGAGGVCRRMVISGTVQGVGFRYSCSREARRLGVNGWVRNLPDGDVEVLAQGSPAAVASLEEWCRRGPSMAAVERVTAHDEPPTRRMERFEVRP